MTTPVTIQILTEQQTFESLNKLPGRWSIQVLHVDTNIISSEYIGINPYNTFHLGDGDFQAIVTRLSFIGEPIGPVISNNFTVSEHDVISIVQVNQCSRFKKLEPDSK